MSGYDSAQTTFQSGIYEEPGIYTNTNIPTSTRKRKSDALDNLAPSEWFDARVLQPSTSNTVTILTLNAIATLLRAHFPLAWLSSDSRSDQLPPGTIIQADISFVRRWDYHVLVARLLPNGGLFAIEHIELDNFVCYPLRHFVSQDHVQKAAFGAAPPCSLSTFVRSNGENVHTRKLSASSVSSHRAVSATPKSPKQPKCRRGVLARQSILAKPTDIALEESEVQHDITSLIQSDITAKHCDGQQTIHDASTDFAESDSTKNDLEQLAQTSKVSDLIAFQADEDSQPKSALATVSVDQLPEQSDQLSPVYLRKRYLEMLYMSKTSLAFYAKGPLSRTRARARVPGASINLEQLVHFYRESILPIKKLDLKYKDSVRSKVLSGTNGDQEEHSSVNLGKTNTTKKLRRTKLGRDALWPVEDEFINKWWSNRDTKDAHARSSTDQETDELQHLISLLRMREMQLQIVLILEVLALEAQEMARPQPGISDISYSDVKVESIETESQNVLAATPPVKKKPRDLVTDLEILLDKLCILHSIGIGDYAIIGDRTATEPPVPSLNNNDRLGDFCKDVIIPFYASKLPSQCQSICKKLGGPDLSPKRPTSIAGRSMAKGLLTNAITSETRMGNRRTLQRVLSEEESARHVSPPVLSRSFTMPTTSHKRQLSERPLSRGGMRKSVSFTNREIDLVADSQATAAKKRKLDQIAAQKRELDAAIETLKKPHRNVVAQTFMNDVEQRRAETKASGRKPHPVHITATPKMARMRSIPKEDYDLPPMPMLTTGSGASIVPSSTVKPRGLSLVQDAMRSSTKKRAVLSAIHDTPSRRSIPKEVSGHPETADDLKLPNATSNHSSSTLVDSPPATSRLRPDVIQTVVTTPLPALSSHNAAVFTPIKRGGPNLEEVFKDAPHIAERANKMMDRAMQAKELSTEMSIYESLGWNDDDEL